MRAVVVDAPGGPDRLSLQEVATPRPGVGEVTIDVRFAGVGLVDALFRSGAFPVSTPFIPGLEVTGLVREVGEGVDGLRPGMRVAALLNDLGRVQRLGGYAEVAVAHASMTTSVPDDVDLVTVTGALVNGVTGWLALHEIARARPTDDVLVLGASGGLGATTARLAAAAPVRTVIGVVSRNRDRAPDCCDEVVLTEELETWAETRTVDVLIDPVGGRPRELLAGRLSRFGRHVVVGNASGVDVAISSDGVWNATTVLAGLSLGATAHEIPDLVAEALQAVVGHVHRGTLEELGLDVQPLEQVRAVHEALENHRAPSKTVLAVAP